MTYVSPICCPITTNELLKGNIAGIPEDYKETARSDEGLCG
jgi:hypothetical protein